MEILTITDELKNWKPNIADIADRLIMGPQRDALEKVEQINNIYGLSLGITKTYRWSPGYMIQIKEWMDKEYIEPQKKRKISTFFNQIDNKQWTYTNFRDKLNILESTLTEMRSRKQTFQDNSEIIELAWNAIMDKLNKEVNGNEDFFNAYIGYYRFEHNNDWERSVNQSDKPAIIFMFNLPETTCNYFIGNKSYPLPICATTLTYTIDLDDFLYRISANTSWIEDSTRPIINGMSRRQNYSRYRGHYNGWAGSYHRNYINDTNNRDTGMQLLHPYISSEEYYTGYRFIEDIDGVRDRIAYACTGDHTNDLQNSVNYLNLGSIYATLYNWHTVYNAASTNPMNQPSALFFGKHKFMDDTFENVIRVNESDCRIANGSTHGPKTYCDQYECLHRKTCGYYNYDTSKAIVEDDEAMIEEVTRVNADNNIHGGEMVDRNEGLSVEERMILWASQRGGAINIVNNERNENG